MDPEDRKLLYKVVKLSEENNDMLKGLYRSMRIRRIFTVIYWTIIIGLTIGAYYLVEPYADSIYGGFKGFSDLIQKLGETVK